uniref:ATP synthase subunit a n=1 Tax=Vagitanus terminalis TaxID=2170276 RepID=A0A344AM12_9HEMI|nr:ATP synthase F0 subunit 6 [Vagitanus terminalis]
MMSNLFSSFDPCTGFVSMNWLSSIIVMIYVPMQFWLIPNRLSYMMFCLLKMIFNEFNSLMMKKSLGIELVLCSLFIFIMLNNFLGLFPYIFTSSSHMVFSMSLALPIWLSFMLFGFIENTNHMFCHLVPSGTPTILMPFMVCIETISNLIRPGSLSVRLMANMVAGHLLMTLLGNSAIDSGMFINFIILVQIMLMLFESAVAMIQSYVFAVLSTLYFNEVI